MPTQSFTNFGTLTSEQGFTGDVGSVSSTSGGVTFTLSVADSSVDYLILLGNVALASNSGFSGTNTFTLTWDDGAGGTQASSISINGNFDLGQILYLSTNGTLAAQSGVAYTGQVTEVQFRLSGFIEAASISDISLSINCFAEGTRMATRDGPRPVETLTEGCEVLTADGRAVKVTWLGRRTINSRTAHPSKVNPIRITAGALGYGLPERDLRLSKDHAVEIDGVLYDTGTLVNDVTIYQEHGVLPESFTYYHIETEAHELLLAEGVAAESFIDHRSRDAFDNSDKLRGPIPEMDLPRVASKRMVPAHIRARLAPKIAAE